MTFKIFGRPTNIKNDENNNNGSNNSINVNDNNWKHE